MQNNALKRLLWKARELENKYEWLQAAEYYGKAVDLAFKNNDFLNAAEREEQMGFCFYRAAFQAQTNVRFRTLLKRAIKTYKKEIDNLEKVKEENSQARINHANALVAYSKSWLETSRTTKKGLFDKWWILEKKVLQAHEASGNLSLIGRTCINIIEWSLTARRLFSGFAERKKMFHETAFLAEKAIQVTSKLGDQHELTRAYCSACELYSFGTSFFADDDEIIQLARKCQDYANKALELSQEIGDAWLIGKSYLSAGTAAQLLKFDPDSATEIAENALKYCIITKDNGLIGKGKTLKSYSGTFSAEQLEDPSKQREGLKKAIKLAQEAIHNYQIINDVWGFMVSYHSYSNALDFLAQLETDPETKRELLETTGKVIQEGLKRIKDWESIDFLNFNLSINLMYLSETKTDLKERRNLLQKAQYLMKKPLEAKEKGSQLAAHPGYWQLSRVQNLLAKIATSRNKKIKLLNSAVISVEKYIKPMEKRKKIYTQSAFGRSFHFGTSYATLGEILGQLYSLTRKGKILHRAIEAYKKAIIYHKSANLPTRVAELCWRVAQLIELQGEWQAASQNYELAAEAYDQASKKIPQLEHFYKNYSAYMRAWSQISLGRYSHSIKEYAKAKDSYDKAAKLHELSQSWSYLASNYFAWANMEEAEGLSRNESTQQAKVTFQKAMEQFKKAEKTIKEKIGETTAEESEMTQKLLQASNLRRKYCQARVLMEDAKLLDREGKYLQSSKSYGEAAENISAIIDKTEAEAERKELEYVAILCRAWGKMADAEEQTSSESYLEAADLFEQAKAYCYTKKASLWALGNSNFCRGLAAGVQYQTRLDLAEHAKAKGYMKNAGTNYVQAGFENAAEYAKATQRLFDAYVFMNQAESEVDPEKRAKQYQMAENVLQIAAGSFMKAKQPEKTAQVKGILATVKEEKALAASLNEVMHAPTITSSTMSFTAPTPASESSVGLESFEHANVQANLVVGLKEVRIGESFCLSVEFVNAGKEPALLTRIEDFVPPSFVVVKKPEIYRVEDSCLNMKGKQIAPLKLVEAKVVLQPSKKGVYQLNPKVHYLDENGQNKQLQLKPAEIKVEEVILSNRLSTGTKEIDNLLLGGIPEEYAVALTGAPSNERELIIGNFLEAGEGGTSFCVATEAAGLESLLQKPNFYLFLCNPKPKVKVPDLPNITKLSSKTDINNLNIALVLANRRLKQVIQKRLCLGIVSDVLLRLGPEMTRRWLSELTTDLVSKGFTVLAVINPLMHTPEELNSVLDLFDGEINLYQTEDPLERKKAVVVKKLGNQDFIKNPICLTKQRQNHR